MKIRIIKKLVDSVFNVRIQTEDWSEHDRMLMVKHGEPEINLGGIFRAEPDTCAEESQFDFILDDIYARVMTESPFTQKFDTRDFPSFAATKEVVAQWIETIEDRIIIAVSDLRAKEESFTTEEIMEY